MRFKFNKYSIWIFKQNLRIFLSYFNACKTKQQYIEIVNIHYKKSLWAMRPYCTMEATLISTIVAFEARKTQKWLLKSFSIRNV